MVRAKVPIAGAGRSPWAREWARLPGLKSPFRPFASEATNPLASEANTPNALKIERAVDGVEQGGGIGGREVAAPACHTDGLGDERAEERA